jgi:hypothetical protein
MGFNRKDLNPPVRLPTPKNADDAEEIDFMVNDASLVRI